MSSHARYDAVVIGGGFFGCGLAEHYRRSLGQRVLMLEREDELFRRASFANQARVHNGYHYPRSLLTAVRCRINFPRFVKEFEECIVSDFEKYYAVGRLFSKVTATQYRQYFDRVGAPIAPAPDRIRRLFNSRYVEEVFAVTEFVFDAVKLKEVMLSRLQGCGVEIKLGAEAESVRQLDDGGLEVTFTTAEGRGRVTTGTVVNCTYSRLNKLLVDSGLPALPLKHELTEMALVEVPEEVRGRAFTMMCGPFFSIMPFPALELYTLSHVRYTPHCQWFDSEEADYVDPYEYLESHPKKTHFTHMVKDVARYMPCLADCRYADSIWEVKTVLPRSEVDDSRPVLYRRDCGLPNLTCIMGGKIDNVYDVIQLEDEYRNIEGLQ